MLSVRVRDPPWFFAEGKKRFLAAFKQRLRDRQATVRIFDVAKFETVAAASAEQE